MPARQQILRVRPLCLLLAALTLAAYFPVGHFDFTNYDEPDYVTGNSYVGQGVTWSGTAWAFQTGHAGNWHPLTWLSHMLDVQLFGMNAGWHHLTNLLFHTANAVLLLLAMRKLTGALWQSAAVAALFALHPLHVESVAWIAERKDVLSTFFGLLSLWTYAAYVESSASGHCRDRPAFDGAQDPDPALRKTLRPGSYYALTIFFFGLSLMSKPTFVTFPFLLLLLDYWPLGRFSGPAGTQTSTSVLWSLLREKLPLLALSIASSVITLIVQTRGETVATLAGLPLLLRLQTTAIAYVSYLCQAIRPANLAVFYPHPGSWPLWRISVAAVILAVISGLAFRFARRKPYLFVGWFWFLGMLVPTIGLVQVGAQSHADRYTYFPLTGLFIIAAWGLNDALARWRFRGALLASAAVASVLACSAVTWLQLRHWANTETLFSHALRVTTSNYVAYLNLGVSRFDRGKTNEAVGDFLESLRIKADNPPALTSLGMAMLGRGDTNEAVIYYRQALQFDPGNSQAHYELGTIVAASGDYQSAADHFATAIAKRPDFPDAHYNLALALGTLNRWDDALAHFEKASRLRPGDAETHNNFGIALASQHKLDRAISEFELAVKARPRFADAHYNLAEARLQQNRAADAVVEYDEALRCRPHWIAALNNLAWLLATHPDAHTRNGRRALTLALEACQLTNYKDISLLQTLAAAYAECGQFSEATATAQSAYDLARLTGQTAWTNTARSRLDLYISGQPLRQQSGR